MNPKLENDPKLHTLFAFGLNHQTAPVEVRESLFLGDSEIPEFLLLLKKSLSECMVVSTCNRTEIYCVSDAPDIDIDFYKGLLIDFKGARGTVKEDHFFTHISCMASNQLFSVATGINSKVIGDSQILRQLRQAYAVARENGTIGKVLNQLLQRAFKIGKRTYTETSLHKGAVSVSLAAVELAIENFGSLHDRTALIIGAGEAARLAAEALAKRNVGKLLVTNRTKLHAEELAEKVRTNFQLDCFSVDFEYFRKHISDADLIISATGSASPILYKKDFQGRSGKTLVVDIALPRDVDPSVGQQPELVLKNIDDTHSIIDRHHATRLNDLPAVRIMIANEMEEFLTWYYSLPLMPAFRKNVAKSAANETEEILKIKELLIQNAPEIHKLAKLSNGNFSRDLRNHHLLVRKLLKLPTYAAT